MLHELILSGDLDDKMKWLKNFERLLEIQRNVVWPGVMELEPKQIYPEFLKAALAKQPCERLIVSPRRSVKIIKIKFFIVLQDLNSFVDIKLGLILLQCCRQILMEGPLQLLDSGKPVEMFVILFDDLLLITRRKKALSKKVNSKQIIKR